MKMATSALATPTYALTDCRDRHDAASALLSCLSSPPITKKTLPPITSTEPTPPTPDASDPTCITALLQLKDSRVTETEKAPLSNRNGLDALATLAAVAQSNDIDISDEEVVPVRRARSVSNPEGMEKWSCYRERNGITIPHSIAEEEEEECLKSTLEEDLEVDPDELLRRARSRLLEDMHQGSGEKGSLTLPHSCAKYKSLYNRNGRIGIYTPAERAAIIARFNSKRSRRVWNKKIRYNCRKNLADRRLRVKGRFVKRSSEEAAKALASAAFASAGSSPAKTTPPSSPEPVKSNSLVVDGKNEEALENAAMEEIDTTDKEAGFEPTEDMPFRRTRRHTIT